MVYRGKVKDGVVVFSGKKKLSEGTQVEVRLRKVLVKRKSKKPATLAEKLAPFIGMADGLPRDMSTNHDHYLYGVAKRKTHK